MQGDLQILWKNVPHLHNNYRDHLPFSLPSNMAATKIIVLMSIFLLTCGQPTLTAPRHRGHSFIKHPGSSSSRDGSTTTRYSILTHASTTLQPSATSPIPLNDTSYNTSYITPTSPVLQIEDLTRNTEKRDTAHLSTGTSKPAPSISNDGLNTDEPFTTPPAPILENGGLHSATPLPNPTSSLPSLPSISIKGTSSVSTVEHGRRSALTFTVLPHTMPAPR